MKSRDSKRRIQLPKDALSRIDLGHSFAEYDRTLEHPEAFVRTPALNAALNRSSVKCFFVGRRGTGKTAITYYLSTNNQSALQLHPLAFVPADVNLPVDALCDTRQRPFQSLIRAYMRAIADEALSEWARKHKIRVDRLPDSLTRERPFIEDLDFDKRVFTFLHEITASLAGPEKEWLKTMNRARDVIHAADRLGLEEGLDVTILLDRLDEAWDGSDKAVAFLMALMHSCVQLTSSLKSIRVLLFLRENIFERVRQIDNEFARLETAVVSLDWSRALLLEFIERRLRLPFNTKPSLGGETWDHFFECHNENSSHSLVLDFCQERPRDVLTYCSFAIDTAQAQKHDIVTIEDLQVARRRFSESRLKDLADEYSENFPRIDLVLSRLYGLGNEFTIHAITGFVQKLLVDDQVKASCASWLFRHTAPVQFVELLYNIGFCGIRAADGDLAYRSVGVKTPTPPPMTQHSHVVVHPCYCDALNLRPTVIGAMGDEVTLQSEGLLLDLPTATSLPDYQSALDALREGIETLPTGQATASEWERLVGETIRLCFFQSLTNVEAKSRNIQETIIRDWVTSNVANAGFWEMVRVRYDATQVIWECKNYVELKADDFHQANYYITNPGGRFIVIVFRGEVQKRYFQHIKRIADDKDGIVLLLTERDVQVLIRQARNGKLKESHIRDIYDRIVRGIS